MEGYTDDANLSDVEEAVSEEEVHISIDNYSSSDEEIDTIRKVPEIMKSSDEKIMWRAKSYPNAGRLESSNILKLTPGATRFSTVRIED